MRQRLLLVGLALTLLLAGCGPRTAIVSGNVTIDGTPLDGGTISFVAADGKAPPVSTEIKGGKYQVAMIEGKKKVQISAPGPTQQRPESAAPGARMMDVPGPERLPPKYHSATMLECEAKGGSETKDWETTTK